MFAGNNENQWLNPVEEEFGSDLPNHDEDNVQNNGTTIELDKDAKASFAKEMKGKDYNLEGIKSWSSMRTHCTNMTGKTGMTSKLRHREEICYTFQSAEGGPQWRRKKTAALEQRLREMESALSSGIPPMVPGPANSVPPLSKSVRISGLPTQSDTTLSQKFDSLLHLHPYHGNTAAESSSSPMADVGRWS